MSKDHIDMLFDDKSSYDIEEDLDAEQVEITHDLDIPLYTDNFEHDSISFEPIDTGSNEFFQKERISEVTGKTVINYVDNDTFCRLVMEWNAACKIAVENGKPKPPMPNAIGWTIIKIANGLATRFNFRNYTYIDEMREDAIYMAIRAVKNFDPTKSSNAFGYFNRVMWTAMTGRIKTEKNQNEIKMSLLKDPMYLGYEAQNADGDSRIDKDKIVSVYEQ